MHGAENTLVFSLFLIFTGAAVFATLALYARQALPIAYIVLGIFIGPYGFKLINNAAAIEQMAQIGIMFLLFLLGLDLSPQRLLQMLRKATLITLGTSLVFAVVSMGVARLFNYAWGECLLIGAAMTFSSTIIGLKLLPTRTLHHQHTGEIIISILLLQDLLAIAILLLIEGLGGRGSSVGGLGLLIVTLPLLLGFAWLSSRYVLIPLIRKFDKIREYIFLIAIGWCLCISQVAALLGLSYAIGAFIGGVALATSPISLYIADSLRPLRDFFLVLFFFSLGAGFDLGMLGAVFMPTLVLMGGRAAEYRDGSRGAAGSGQRIFATDCGAGGAKSVDWPGSLLSGAGDDDPDLYGLDLLSGEDVSHARGDFRQFAPGLTRGYRGLLFELESSIWNRSIRAVSGFL